MSSETKVSNGQTLHDSANWLLIASDFVSTGGMDRANLALAHRLAEYASVEIVSHRVEKSLQGQPNIKVSSVSRPLGMNLFGEILLSQAGAKRASQLAKRRPVNVLTNGGNCIWPNAINWVHYVHAAYEPTPCGSLLRQAKARYYHRRCTLWERRALRAARWVICNSELTARHVIELVGVDAERVLTIYLGVNQDEFYVASEAERAQTRLELGWLDERPRLMFIGGLSDRRKGFDTLATAWEALCKRSGWDGQLVVLGAGAERSAWQARMVSKGLGNTVHFLGIRDDVPRLLRAADALVAPSRYEAYGLSAHEAICCGMPAFVSQASGIAERFPAALGHLLLPDPTDASQLVDKLIQWRSELRGYRDAILPFANSLRERSWNQMADDIAGVIYRAR